MTDRPIFTYQTRLALDPAQAAVLDAYAALHGKVERCLFAALRSGRNINDLKREFLPRFGITARQFNAVRVGVESKIDSIKARRPELISELESRIKQAAKVVAKLSLSPSKAAKLHQKKRRLAILQTKLASMKADEKAGVVRMAFGSRRLFRAQFDLQANGYASHEAWKAAWRARRSSQIFVLGSGDETAGNQTCQAQLVEDGSLNLVLRLPNSLLGSEPEASKTLTLTGVRFAYGHGAIVSALQTSRRIASVAKGGKSAVKRTGSALSYRFLRDDAGWRVFVSCEAQPVESISRSSIGAVGVDINADHLAVSEIERFGNLVTTTRIKLNTYGKTTDQAKALIGDAAVAIVQSAAVAGKPVAIERLDFAKKKAELEGTEPRHARMLSSFTCNKVVSSIKSAAFRAGVQVIEVNPAYTSVIGALRYAQVKGISVHQGAAVAIARRGLGLSERCPAGKATVPVRNGGHVTLCVPERNRSMHVWSQWGKVRITLRAAHVAHGRSGQPKGKPAPLSPEMRALGATWSSAARLRSANRQQNCSADVLGDIPL